jgi:hypothetical protein
MTDEMDEFGQQPFDKVGSEKEQVLSKPSKVVPTKHEERKPTLPAPRSFDDRVAPFAVSDMLTQHQQSHSESEKEVSGGCCSKCIIM